MSVVLVKRKLLMAINGNMKNSNIDRFGHVDDLRLEDSGNGKWAVYSNGKQLTNVLFQ